MRVSGRKVLGKSQGGPTKTFDGESSMRGVGVKAVIKKRREEGFLSVGGGTKEHRKESAWDTARGGGFWCLGLWGVGEAKRKDTWGAVGQTRLVERIPLVSRKGTSSLAKTQQKGDGTACGQEFMFWGLGGWTLEKKPVKTKQKEGQEVWGNLEKKGDVCEGSREGQKGQWPCPVQADIICKTKLKKKPEEGEESSVGEKRRRKNS